MKAAVCREFGQPLVIEEVTLAEPQLGEIRVRTAACAICHSDILYARGAWGGELPAVYGHEAAGIVESIGPGVSDIQPGDHVVVTLVRACGNCFYCNLGERYNCETQFPLDEQGPLKSADGAPVVQGLRTGAFAEYIVVDQSQAIVIPDEIPLDSASLVACGVITGMGAVLNTAMVRPASNVVVIGTGGVGLNSVQGAAVCNAKTVIAIDLSDSKLAAARSFGATDTINPAAQDARKSVLALTQNRGADYVFVTVGSIAAIEQGITLLRPGGMLVLVGMTAEGEKAAFEALDLANYGQRIVGSKMGAVKPRVDVPNYVALYQQKRIKLDELITNRYALDQINEAIAEVERGEALRNVIIF